MNMKKVFEKVHFDKDKKPKRLQISFNSPTKTERGYLKEGDVVLTVFSKDATAGFLLTTGDVADLINALETIRRELLADMISLRRQDT